jgi:peroxiredoxin
MASHRRRELLDAGVRAPDFTLRRLVDGEAGDEVSLAGLLTNGPAVLAFFKMTCPVCQMTLPFLERIHQAAPGALPIYGISQNDARDTRDFVRHFGLTFPMLLDDEDEGFVVSNAYGISSVPTIFLVERDGIISTATEGWSRRDIAALGERAGSNPLRPSDNVPELKAG